MTHHDKMKRLEAERDEARDQLAALVALLTANQKLRSGCSFNESPPFCGDCEWCDGERLLGDTTKAAAQHRAEVEAGALEEAATAIGTAHNISLLRGNTHTGLGEAQGWLRHRAANKRKEGV